ncbi:MAG TPA: alanine racemase [Clostridiaceae bacterium]
MYNIKKIRPAYAEINLDNLVHNLNEVKKLIKKDTLIMAVIKADGYGHGAKKIAQILLDNGSDKLAVAILDEGIQLRNEGIKAPILILGYTNSERADEIISYDLEQTVYYYELAEALSKEASAQNKTVKIQISIDTGMGRIGLQPNETSIKLVKKISELPNVVISGIYTHFAAADEKDKTYTIEQFGKFIWTLNSIKSKEINIGVRHCANSATIIDLPSMQLDMVRAGIILYGVYPSQEVSFNKLDLKPVMTLKVRVCYVKEIEAGQSISYGRKFIASKKTKIASLPIGYADGFTRMLASNAEALIKGIRVPIVGHICMDQCMLDVTGIDGVEIGDEVVLLGEQNGASITVNEIASKLNTINYEIFTMISKRVPRVYIKNEQIVDVLNYLL